MFGKIALICGFAACALAATVPAGAKGTIVVRKSNGATSTYNDVSIKVLHGALYLTSQDGRGTIIVNRAACSYQGKLMVCFATSAALIQSGKTSPLDLKTGTVYLNDTDDPQPLVLSSAKVPPHGIMLSLNTNRGTYVGLNGRIDSVVK